RSSELPLSFPYTTLFRSDPGRVRLDLRRVEHEAERLELFGEGLLEGRLVAGVVDLAHAWHGGIIPRRPSRAGPARWTHEPFLDRDRKSTRLNSSHGSISY